MFACPKCSSHNLRHSHLRSPSERLASLFGVHPIRCRDCRTRFILRTWRLTDLRYARCPKCLRMDLAVWSLSHYRVPPFRSFLISLGANPYRCEYCRHNFVSFRRRKERFDPKRYRQPAMARSEPPANQGPNTLGDGI